jgi:hypothetical protein
LVDLLRELNQDASWRKLYGAQSKRLKDQELILRFFAFLYLGPQYARPMKEFLNRFMGSNQQLQQHSKDELSGVFRSTAKTLADVVGDQAFRPVGPINAAVADSVMVAVAQRLMKGAIREPASLKSQYESLIKHKGYRELVDSSTAQEDAVRERFRLAQDAIAAAK